MSARAHDPGMRADKARYVSEMFTCIAGQYGLMTFAIVAVPPRRHDESVDDIKPIFGCRPPQEP